VSTQVIETVVADLGAGTGIEGAGADSTATKLDVSEA